MAPPVSFPAVLYCFILVPADEARTPPASARPLPGQTPGSRWAGGSGRYLRKSGKEKKQPDLQITRNLSFTSPADTTKSELIRFLFIINNPSRCLYTLVLLATPLFIQQKRFHRPLRAEARKKASPVTAKISARHFSGLFMHLNKMQLP